MNQHLVARAILRRFCSNESGLVSWVSRDSVDEESSSVSRVASVVDLVPNPERLERSWNTQVEGRLGHAFELLDARKLVNTPKAVETIKRCIALHWARSFTMVELVRREKESKGEELAASLIDRFGARMVFEQLTGLIAPEEQADEMARVKLKERFDQSLTDESFLKSILREHFATARKKVEPFCIEIREASADEFLIADCPVVTWSQGTDQVGVLNGVSWSVSDVLFMPLGPRHVAALSQENRCEPASSTMVRRINELQTRNAIEYVYFRPGSDLGTFARAVWSGD